MSSSSLERVQHDLNLIKSALPSDFPYDRGSVALSAAATACAGLLGLRAITGWDRTMSGLILAVIAGMMVASGVWLRRARSERAKRPRRWSWARQEVVSSSVAVVAMIVYAAHRRLFFAAGNEPSFEAWRGELAGPGLFAAGAAMFALGLARFERRSFLGWGLAMALVALAMPWIPSRSAFTLVAGTAMAAGGFVSTLVMWYQLRQWEAAHAGD